MRENYSIADVAGVFVVMSHEFGSALDVAIVELVVEESIDGNDHRFLHLVRYHSAYYWLHFFRSTKSSRKELLRFSRR